ncbi:MAG: TetR/AcrR family transcriptional regulator [Pseudomonadota bacterium]
MTERQREILGFAIQIIADEGYGKLSMRALARLAGIKLGALQYHFPTWSALLTALADHIIAEYMQSVIDLHGHDGTLEIVSLVETLLEDNAGQKLRSDRLLPQLWAMGRVEPAMATLLKRIYENYLARLEESLATAGSKYPRAEALSLMSMIEGSVLFVDGESPWASDAKAMQDFVLGTLREKYGFVRPARSRKKEKKSV